MPLYAKMLPPLSFDEVQIHCRVYLKGFYQTYLHLLGPDKNSACSSGASTHVCTATNFTVTQEIGSFVYVAFAFSEPDTTSIFTSRYCILHI